MNLKQLSEILESNPESSIEIMLPSFLLIPSHFHVTEVGRVQKNFIDCGGTQRESISCVLQIWTANDFEHRLAAGKLSDILKLAGESLQLDDLPIELEYGPESASYFILDNVQKHSKCLLFVLTEKHTNCLAPDKCGVQCENQKCCGGKNGCC